MLNKVMTALKTLNELSRRHAQGQPDENVYEYVYNLFILVVTWKPKIILELGTAEGFSTRALLAALKFNGEGYLFTVDLPGSWSKRSRERLIPQLKELGFERHVKFLLADDVKMEWTRHVDMIFLDTNHKYEHTLAELNKFSKWTRLIVLHDTRIDTEVQRSVQKAIDTFLQSHPEWINREVGATPCGLGFLYKTKP